MFPAISVGVCWRKAFHGKLEMNEPDLPSEEEFKARLKAVEGKKEKTFRQQELQVERSGAWGRAWRLSVEMIAALLLCGGFGLFLDNQFETKPVLMLIFLFIGVAVGFWGIYKTAMDMNAGNMDE